MISLRTGFVAGNLMLLGLLSYFAATLAMDQLGWALAARTAPPPAPAAQVKGRVARVKLPLREFQPILAINIFKAERTPKKPAGLPIVNPGLKPDSAAPLTQLAPQNPLPPLILAGTMVFGKRGFAIVADSSGRNKRMYRPGECMPSAEKPPNQECQPSQSKLLTVLRKSILVRYLEKTVTLSLNQKYSRTAFQDSIRRSNTRRTTNNRLFRRPSSGQKVRPGLPSARAAVDSRVVPLSQRNVFPSVRRGNSIDIRVPAREVKKSMANFSSVLKQARVVPYSGKDGTGFQIRSIRPGSIFQRIGLINFDVIKAVNGNPLTTADQAIRLLTVFQNEREITLDVRRRGREIKLNYLIE